MARVRLALVLAAALAAAGTLGVRGAQSDDAQQPPVFRGGTETVGIFATVLDRDGELVLNLHRDDFTVEDDGRPQTITTFGNGVQPITAALLVDTSASMTLNLELAQMAAEQFVIRMLPTDRARVGSFSDRIDLSPTFTSDRDALLQSLRTGLHIGNPTKLWDAVAETMTALEPLGGRRIILLFTDGMDTISTAREADILARARAEDVMIYVVQFRSTPLANLAEVPLAPSASEVFRGDPRFRNPPPTEALRQLARQTGGGHFLLSEHDDVNATFTAVMNELHHQYALGFVPERFDNKLHALTVTVDRPGVTVRARRSYLARHADATP
ncbi:MAG TPA: VWA domain-containing protein [Vicinamibacterales bacterium]|jgi:VWFA-related protein|nr:VWA domain-containing protein [Vicinamibacterales bacterium]